MIFTIVPPPSPANCRWVAQHEAYVPGDPVGHGETREAAQADLEALEAELDALTDQVVGDMFGEVS